MNPGLLAMMALLVVVAVIHTQSRIGGALATIGWCVAAFVFGWFELEKRANGVVFLEVQTPKWVYFVVVGSVMVWNFLVVGKALSRRVTGPRKSAETAAETTAPETQTTTTPPT